MFCQNCGKPLEANTRFCQNCGSPVTENFNAPADNNPYSAAHVVPVVPVAPVQNQPVYTNPANTVPTYPQSSAPTYASQPQYLRPVQTPQGIQYVPAEPIVSYKKPEPKFNPFVFISMGIMGLMIILCFFPWFTAEGQGFNLLDVFSYNIYLERFEMDAVAACSLLMIVAVGLLIPGIILALVRKNQFPVGFSVAASVITLVTLLCFVSLLYESKGNVNATSVPVIMLTLSILNFIFPPIARKVDK